jgi:hypothetical protein
MMKLTVLSAAAVVIFCLSAQHAAGQDSQDQGIQTRGAFFATRPAKGGNEGVKGRQDSASNRKNGTQTAAKSKSTGTPKGGAVTGNSETAGVGAKGPSSGGPSSGGVAVLPVSASGLGLGYTLFMRDAGGPVRVDPQREFTQGEGIRIALETNTDGYLYVFHTENGRDPQMLYPHPTLDRGENRITGHRLYQVPTSLDTWFEFDERPAVERLYIVLSRKPLDGVLTGAALVKSCGASPADCYWKPTASVWNLIERESKGRTLMDRSENYEAIAQATVERDSLTRGIKLSKSDPAPAVVVMTASPSAPVFVTTIDLKHK